MRWRYRSIRIPKKRGQTPGPPPTISIFSCDHTHSWGWGFQSGCPDDDFEGLWGRSHGDLTISDRCQRGNQKDNHHGRPVREGQPGHLKIYIVTRGKQKTKEQPAGCNIVTPPGNHNNHQRGSNFMYLLTYMATGRRNACGHVETARRLPQTSVDCVFSLSLFTNHHDDVVSLCFPLMSNYKQGSSPRRQYSSS